MRYVFIDDSALNYDGYTPMRRALGGAEKALIGLCSALFERGHEVHVINRTSYAHMADGAYWVPMGDPLAPKSTDVLIALRKPALLGSLRSATHRLLLVVGDPAYLAAPANEPLWESFGASLLFIGQNQKRAYKGKVRHSLITPGVRAAYFLKPTTPVQGPQVESHPEYYDPPEETATVLKEADEAVEAAANVQPEEPPPPPPPHAVVTTHPLQGLDWLVDVWTQKIHPQMPAARLAVYSAVLSKGLKGEEIPVAILPVLQKVQAAAGANVVVVVPRNDDGMADVYRESRVHLYPGDKQDFACWTLAESQATGLPAVARALGGVDERIDNGESGYIVPDAEAFANVTLQILRDDAFYKNLSAAAAPTRRRVWATAVEELEAFVATLPAAAV